MNTLIPCPHCHQLLQPPEKASKHAKLRCPLCLHELLACDLVMGVHRAWVVIDDPGGVDVFHEFHTERKLAEAAEQAELASRFRAVALNAQQNAATPTEELKTDLPITEGGQEDFEEYQIATADADSANAPSGPEKIDWSRFKPLTHEDFQRRRRQSRSPIGLIFNIVLGGVLAIPIALLIMWHILGTDVGDAGPMVSRFLPWIVPAKFHAKNLDVPTPTNVGWRPNGGGNPIRTLGSSKKEENGIASDGTNSKENGIGRLEKFEAMSGVKGEVQNDDEVDETSKSTANSDLGAAESTEDSENHPKLMDVRGAKISAAIKDWQQTTVAWQEFSGDNREQKSRLAQAFYRGASKVATELKWMDPNSPAAKPWHDQAWSQLRHCASDRVLSTLVDVGGRRVSLQDLQDGEGIALKIQVQNTTSVPGFQRLSVLGDWKYGDRAIEFRDARNGRWTEATQGEFLVLGVLRKPAETLSEPHVIEPSAIPVIEVLCHAPVDVSP